MSVFSGPVTVTIEPAEEDDGSPSFTFKYEGQKLWMPFSMAVRTARVVLDLAEAFGPKTPEPAAPPEPLTLAIPDPPET